MMDSHENAVYNLLGQLEEALDKGMPLLSNLVVVKKEVVTELLDAIYSVLPTEVREARVLLKRKDDIKLEAQQRAERIIRDAQAEAARLLSESNILKTVQLEVQKIKEQVVTECDSLKRQALDEAESIRIQARDEAVRMRDGANVYVEQVLANLEGNLNQLQQVVKSGQMQLERQRGEISDMGYAGQEQANAPVNYKID